MNKTTWNIEGRQEVSWEDKRLVEKILKRLHWTTAKWALDKNEVNRNLNEKVYSLVLRKKANNIPRKSAYLEFAAERT